ncbi:MAG: DUF4249 family protein [Bacteroidales bacterium]|nr:DUF4249 family protein [Bacteroidales bacterium]
MRKILTLLAVSLCAAACIYPYTPELEEAPEGVLTVDGNISIGDVSTVRLGSLRPLWPSETTPKSPNLRKADVWVEDEDGTKYPGKWESSGSSTSGDIIFPGYTEPYDASPTFTIHTEDAPADRRYRLCVEALDELYVSDWSDIAPAPVIRKIEFLCGENDDQVTVAVSVDGGDGGTGYLQLSYDETWEFHAEYFPSFIVNTNSWDIQPGTPPGFEETWFYWCWRSADNHAVYPLDYSGMAEKGIASWPLTRFPRTDNRNHRRYCIRVKAKSLNDASYRFLKNLEQNTDGGDNLFTPTPGEIAGNLRCETDPERMILGYVTIGRTVWKRAFLDSRYYRDHAPSRAGIVYPTKANYPTVYYQGYLPLFMNDHLDYDPAEEGEYGWGSRRCYDCVAAGGTKQKPDYWDQNE